MASGKGVIIRQKTNVTSLITARGKGTEKKTNTSESNNRVMQIYNKRKKIKPTKASRNGAITEQ